MVQVLQEEEKIEADDIILSVRVLTSERKQLLLPAVDFPINRKSSLAALSSKLWATFPELRALAESKGEAAPPVLRIAKGFTTGPTLTVKSALALKWIEVTGHHHAHPPLYCHCEYLSLLLSRHIRCC